MPAHSPRRDADTWPATLAWLLVAFMCYALPWHVFAALPPAENGKPVLRIQGSNTLGAHLLPELVKGLLLEQGYKDIGSEARGDNEQRVHARDGGGREVFVDIAAHGSSTGFAALKDGSADLAAASRPIKDSEADALSAFGNLRSARAEQVIGLDGVAIIVHRDNPLTALTLEQLARVFCGEVKTWEALGGRGGAIHLYARDEQSGTFETFRERVLAGQARSLASDAQRYESSDALSARVAADPQGIGFVGLASVLKSKPLAIADGQAQAMLPSPANVATEDYPLSRRLYLYLKPTAHNAWADALVQFVQGDRGQALVGTNGFVGQRVQALRVTPRADMPQAYRELASNAQRLSLNFRFSEGSATLDNKAQRDIERLVDYLRRHAKNNGQALLVGFGDARQDPQRDVLLSKLRAMAVRRELAREGVLLRGIEGLGAALPVAADDAEGRLKNRRVEVWVY